MPFKLAHAARVLCLGFVVFLCCVQTAAAAATLYATGIGTFPALTDSALYTIDPVTGTPTLVGSLDTQLPGGSLNTIYNGGIAYDPFADRLYAMGCDQTNVSTLYEVDRTNGHLTVIGASAVGNELCNGGVTFDVTNGKLYAVGNPGGQQGGLWEIDPDTGAGGLIGYTGVNQWFMHGVGSDPATGILYANGRGIAGGPNGEFSALFVLNKLSGEATLVGGHGVAFGRQLAYSGLAFDPVTGEMLSLGSTSASAQGLWVVDKTTGLATPRGAAQNPKIGVDGGLVFVEPVANPVPLATPLAAFVSSSLLGWAGWVSLRRRRGARMEARSFLRRFPWVVVLLVSVIAGATTARAAVTSSSVSAAMHVIDGNVPPLFTSVVATDSGATTASVDVTPAGASARAHSSMTFSSVGAESAVFEFSIGMHGNGQPGSNSMGVAGDNKGVLHYDAPAPMTATVFYDYDIGSAGTDVYGNLLTFGMGAIQMVGPSHSQPLPGTSGSVLAGHYQSQQTFDLSAGPNTFTVWFTPNVGGGAIGWIDGQYDGTITFVFAPDPVPSLSLHARVVLVACVLAIGLASLAVARRLAAGGRIRPVLHG